MSRSPAYAFHRHVAAVLADPPTTMRRDWWSRLIELARSGSRRRTMREERRRLRELRDRMSCDV